MPSGKRPGSNDGNGGVDPGRPGAQRNQGVHGGFPVLESRPGPGEETAPHVDHDGEGQEAAQEPEDPHGPMIEPSEPGNQVGVPDDGDGNPQDDPYPEPPEQVSVFGLSLLFTPPESLLESLPGVLPDVEPGSFQRLRQETRSPSPQERTGVGPTRWPDSPRLPGPRRPFP